MKKALILVVSFILVIALTIMGTVAYLTDRDSKVNVFTVGDVEIELSEQFIQGTELMPGKQIEKIPTITNTGDSDAWVWLTFSIPSALDNAVQGTEQGSNENIIHWNPTGATTEGYVNDTRVAKAIQQGLLPEGITAADILASNSTWNVFNSLGQGQNFYTETIDGVSYNTYVLLYNKALEANESTLTGIYNIFLDARVDYNKNDNKYYLVENGVATEIAFDIAETKIIISAYAVQKDNIASVNDAYAAYGAQWGDNGKPEYVEPTVVSNDADLAAALENGGLIYLSDGTYSLEAGTVIPEGTTLVPANKDVTIEIPAPTTKNTSAVALGNNVVLKGLNIKDNGVGYGNSEAGLVTVKGENVVIEDCSFDISGTNAIAVALGGGAVNTTIKDCDFVGGYKHIGPAPGNPKGVVIDGCTFEGLNSTYAIHLNATSHDTVIKNSSIALFNTFFGFGNDAGKLVFENCDFVVEPGKTNVVKLYRDADFVDCDFEEGYLFSDANKALTLTFEGGSWGNGTIKEHFLADSFSYNMNATFDGDAWYWNTTTDTWEDK